MNSPLPFTLVTRLHWFIKYKITAITYHYLFLNLPPSVTSSLWTSWASLFRWPEFVSCTIIIWVW